MLPLCLLLLSLTTAGALRVTMEQSPVRVLRGEDVTIPCNVSDLNPRTAIELIWIRKSGNRSTDVYRSLDGRVTVSTPRYHVNESEILRGNPALHISEVQFVDEGEYTCAVVNTPNEHEGTSSLQVSARPSVTLTPEELRIELGTEKSIVCEVTYVYPHTMTIQWVRYNKDSPGCVPLERGTCTTDPAANSDGTFNITSHLTLNPQKEDNEYRYSCIVTHRSLDIGVSRNFTLTVTEQEDNTGTIIWAMAGTFFCTLLTVVAVLFYLNMVKKDPPTLSDITGNDHLTDMSRATLTCHITNYRPNDIIISVCLRRSGEQETIIYTWRSRDPPEPLILTTHNGGGAAHIDMEEQRQLVNGALRQEEGPLQLELVPVISRGKFGLSSCQCSLHITPSYDTDNGAELSVRVTHPALTSPASVQRTLSVVGVAPHLLRIMTPGRILHGEKVTLTCPIIGFKPRVLSITWLRRERDNQEKELVTWNSGRCDTRNVRYSHNLEENDHDDKSYSFLSALTLRASVMEDDGLTYSCRTSHPATQQQAEERLNMVVTAAPVLDSIVKFPEVVIAGDHLTLSCRIHSFYPKDIQVTWYTEDGVPLPARTGESLQGASGFYSVNSAVTYTPSIRDKGKTFQCEVQHDSLETPKHIAWTLSDLMSPPSVGDIQSDPAHPERGKPLTLSCTVRDMYPAAQHIQWYRGLTKLPSDHWRDAIKEDPESGMYCGTAELTLTPSTAEHGDTIFLEITHSAKTVTREFTLRLRGMPAVSEISSDPVRPEYGRPLTLSCCVTGCDPGDITVTWSAGERGLGRGDHEKKGGGSMLYTLSITPTAEDYGKVYNCHVTHRDLLQPIIKSLHLRLPDKSPALSDITVRPARARANQEASFQVVISRFSPRDLQVTWYKGFSQCPGNAVTSSDPLIGAGGFYTCSSTLILTPTQSDHHTTIRCEVTHRVSNSIQERRHLLDLTGSADSVDGAAAADPPREKTTPIREERPALSIEKIECRTERPLVGGEVTLVGRVAGCEAESGEFSWYKGMYPIAGKMENRQDGSSCISSITFTAEESDTDCTIRLEVTCNYQTVEGSYRLRLG